MEFDPLSLFTARTEGPEFSSVYDTGDAQYLPASTTGDVKKDVKSNEVFEDVKSSEDFDDVNEDHLIPIHIHDLPILQLHPPAEVLLVFLKLLSPNEVYNFAAAQTSSPVSSSHDEDDAADITVDPIKVFKEKNVALDQIELLRLWLAQFNPRFDTVLKLAMIPYLSQSLKKNFDRDYNSWLTRIVASDLHWIECPSSKTEITKLSSLRIAENCGRTAQPEIIRKIGIPNLGSIMAGDSEYIRLKEPSLTSDNLGLKTWGSALILANRLVCKQHSEKYLHGSVLELGSGTGLVGMISSMLGFDTMVTDLKEITPNLQDNVELNNLAAQIRVEELDWSDPTSFTNKYGAIKFDTIILSDPIYSSMHPYWVVNMIKIFLRDDSSARVLLQIPIRKNFDQERDLLWNLMQNANYKAVEEEIEHGYDDFGENHFYFKKFVKS